MAATNHLYSAAEKDGTAIGLLQNNNPLAQLFGNKAARFDATKFNWLGTPSIEVAVVVLWHTVRVNSVDEPANQGTSMGASRRAVGPGVRRAAAEFHARHKDAGGARLQGHGRHLPRDGARRGRRLSRGVLLSARCDAPELAAGEERRRSSCNSARTR